MKEEFIRVTDSTLQRLLFRQPGQFGCQSIYPGRKWPWRFSLLFMMSSPPNLSRAAITHFYYSVDDQEDRNVFCGPESCGGGFGPRVFPATMVPRPHAFSMAAMKSPFPGASGFLPDPGNSLAFPLATM